MQFFIDTADIDEIREAKRMGILDGVTTNPSLIAKTGRDFQSVVHDICREVDGPISLEVISTQAEEMVKEAEGLAGIHRNVVVKVPITVEGMKAMVSLSKKGIKTNCTLVFSPIQALLAAKAGATYVSPFVGRLDDISEDGMELVEKIIQIYDQYEMDTQVIVASVRNPMHVLRAALLGADVVTVPFQVLVQLAKHPLTDIGLKKFLQDWERVPKR
ncbi:MAG: fructose-6-phosphate aldolase [bacterium]